MSDEVDHSRRRLLTAATVGTGAIGVAFAAVPFLASWKPSARAKALGAPVEVDASKLEAGQMLKVVWRGQPVFVVRRVKDSGRSAGRSRRHAGRSEVRRLDAARLHQIDRRGARAQSRVLGGPGGVHASRLLAARAHSSRTIRSKWPARIWARTGPAASTARATARSTICPAASSRACRRRRI